jgi:hypothetical protein
MRRGGENYLSTPFLVKSRVSTLKNMTPSIIDFYLEVLRDPLRFTPKGTFEEIVCFLKGHSSGLGLLYGGDIPEITQWDRERNALLQWLARDTPHYGGSVQFYTGFRAAYPSDQQAIDALIAQIEEYKALSQPLSNENASEG